MSLDEHIKEDKEDEEEVVARRQDGSEITREEIDKKFQEIREGKVPTPSPPQQEVKPKKEEESMPEQEPTTEIEPMPAPTELARPKPTTTTKGELVRGDEIKKGEIMSPAPAPAVTYFTPGTLTDTALIARYKLVENIDFYRIGNKAIFQKEGLLKLLPLVRVDGYGVSHEVAELIDEPNYKRVKIRAWIGPKDNPIRVAEATTDWRSELNEADIILKALKNNQVSESALIEKEGNYSIDWLKHPALLQKFLRNNVFALRITEGKALRRAWAILAGVTTVPLSEIKVLTDEIEHVQEEQVKR